MKKTERIHGLDSLRAIMMFLGLVIHVSLTYVPEKPSYWFIKDPISYNIFFDALAKWIHIFRMPIFFIISGFFSALLFYERNPKKMFFNRINRIVFPFIAGLFLIIPIYKFSVSLSTAIFSGEEHSLQIALKNFNTGTLFPLETVHLWFLYYLAYISFIFWFIAKITKKYSYRNSIFHKSFDFILKNNFLGIILFSFISFFALRNMGTSTANASFSLVPNYKLFTFYVLYFSYGWFLFRSKNLLKIYIPYTWTNISIGTIFFTFNLYFNLFSNFELIYAQITYSIAIWFYNFGFMGLFLKYFNFKSSKMRYMSDASYWVYLVHLPIVIYLPSLILELEISAFSKFAIIMFLSFGICMLSYHYLVRSTFIGKFLNGRTYPYRPLFSWRKVSVKQKSDLDTKT
ncbi:acyltransferase family protein [Aureivirga sp. CE67]|uniref:acyltransferase family protein n=1 Tax=Aureivirga sp. CE67 TaxID=1788983 RepID=UPI0018C9EE6C|nr:acyltransferase family protein [Aureivirga sp. CE67]